MINQDEWLDLHEYIECELVHSNFVENGSISNVVPKELHSLDAEEVIQPHRIIRNAIALVSVIKQYVGYCNDESNKSYKKVYIKEYALLSNKHLFSVINGHIVYGSRQTRNATVEGLDGLDGVIIPEIVAHYIESTNDDYAITTRYAINYLIDLSSGNYRYVETEDAYFNIQDVVEIEDEYYVDGSEAYYEALEEENSEQRTRIHSYHCGLRPIHYLKDGEKNEPKGLSQFTIGFEVEKSEEHDEGDSVAETELYSHWEKDSSCGIEGITNVYSLNNLETFVEHAKRATHLTDDFETSLRCGGHTNIAFNPNSMNDFDLTMYSIQPFVGVLYAMFKRRLNNEYSINNKELKEENSSSSYSAIRLKRNPNRLEFRIPSAIKNTNQLIRRFRLMQKLMSHVYARSMHCEKYALMEEDANTYLDIKYGKRTLYKNFQKDSMYKKEFFDTDIYKRTRWLLHDLSRELEEAYAGEDRQNRFGHMILDTYAFQAWLQEKDKLVYCYNIRDYVKIKSSYYSWTPDIPEEEQINTTMADITDTSESPISENYHV